VSKTAYYGDMSDDVCQVGGDRGVGLVCMVESGGFPPCLGLSSVVLLFSQAVYRQVCWLYLLGARFRAEIVSVSSAMVFAMVGTASVYATSDVLHNGHVGTGKSWLSTIYKKLSSGPTR